LALVASVRATGEKTASALEVRRTGLVSWMVSLLDVFQGAKKGGGLPSVPRPPMGNFPKRRKGTEKVTTLGVTSRMTMTSSGFWGMSLEDMVAVLLFVVVVILAVSLRGNKTKAAVALVRRTSPETMFVLLGDLLGSVGV